MTLVKWSTLTQPGFLLKTVASPFGQYAKFSIHWVPHSDNHPTHTLHPTLGHASNLLHQEGQVPFSTLLVKQSISIVLAPAILFLPYSFLLLSHTINKPAVTPECQSLDAKPQHVMTMHNPYNNSTSWETKQCMKWFCVQYEWNYDTIFNCHYHGANRFLASDLNPVSATLSLPSFGVWNTVLVWVLDLVQ